jgi:hypothetical protein
MVDEITSTLQKYSVPIHHSYSVDNYHHILADEMIITIDLKKKFIYVAFKAGCRAEVAASNILILLKAKSVTPKNIEVTEDFIYNDNKEALYGDEAYDYVHQRVVMGVMGKMFKDKNELSFLMDSKIEGNC